MFGVPVQVAYATDDVHATARRWAERGIGPFFVIEHIALTDVEIDGATAAFDHSSAYGQWGPVMVELIQQHDPGPDPVVGTSGIHHVASFVDDFEVAERDTRGRRIPATFEGVDVGRSGVRVPRCTPDAGPSARDLRANRPTRRVLLDGARRVARLDRQRPGPHPLTVT